MCVAAQAKFSLPKLLGRLIISLTPGGCQCGVEIPVNKSISAAFTGSGCSTMTE